MNLSKALSDNITLQVAPQIREICMPFLEPLNIWAFDHMKIYPNGKICILNSNPQVTKDWLKDNLLKKYSEGVTFSDLIPYGKNMSFLQLDVSALLDKRYDKIIERNREIVKYFRQNFDIGDRLWIVNKNKHYLESFIYYFKSGIPYSSIIINNHKFFLHFKGL